MQRLIFVFIVIFAVACAGFAQSSGSIPMAPPAGAGVSGNATGSPSGQTPLAPAPGEGVTPAAGASTTNNGNVTSTGVTTSGGVIGTTVGAGPVAPEVHLETAMPGPGASSSTAGAPAGVSSNPNNVGTPSSPTTYTVSAIENAAQPKVDSNAAAGPAAIQDTNGMVYAGAAYSGEAVDNRSLAEIAAQYKRGRVTQNAHVYTNADVARLNPRNDVNVMGANQNASLPQGEGDAPQTTAKKNQKRSPFAPKTNEPPQP